MENEKRKSIETKHFLFYVILPHICPTFRQLSGSPSWVTDNGGMNGSYPLNFASHTVTRT